MIKMKVLIVIINYNGIKLLKKHLASVLNTRYSDFNILVVDNGSTDGSIDFLKKEFPSVLIVKSKKNLGFGRANNLGVYSYPGYDGYVLLNNDMSVNENWLTELVDVVKQGEKIGAVGCKILYSQKENGKYIINSAGMEVNEHFIAYDRYDRQEDSKEFDIVEQVDALSGGAMLITKEAWDTVGGFNSHMFLYYEDVDISLRLRDFNFKLYYCGKSVVYHDHMGTSKLYGSFKRNFLNMKNRHISIGSRLGFLVGFTETLWYIFNWSIWKLMYSKRYTLREYLAKNDE